MQIRPLAWVSFFVLASLVFFFFLRGMFMSDQRWSSCGTLLHGKRTNNDDESVGYTTKVTRSSPCCWTPGRHKYGPNWAVMDDPRTAWQQLFSFSCFECTHIPWMCSRYYFVGVIRDGVPQLVSTVPLRTGTAVQVWFCTCLFRTGTAVHVLFCTSACFLPSRRLLSPVILWPRARLEGNDLRS